MGDVEAGLQHVAVELVAEGTADLILMVGEIGGAGVTVGIVAGGEDLRAIDDGSELGDGGGERELQAEPIDGVRSEGGDVGEVEAVGVAVKGSGGAGESGSADSVGGVGVGEAVAESAEGYAIVRR